MQMSGKMMKMSGKNYQSHLIAFQNEFDVSNDTFFKNDKNEDTHDKMKKNHPNGFKTYRSCMRADY